VTAMTGVMLVTLKDGDGVANDTDNCPIHEDRAIHVTPPFFGSWIRAGALIIDCRHNRHTCEETTGVDLKSPSRPGKGVCS
jgi:hypothetical protein